MLQRIAEQRGVSRSEWFKVQWWQWIEAIAGMFEPYPAPSPSIIEEEWVEERVTRRKWVGDRWQEEQSVVAARPRSFAMDRRYAIPEGARNLVRMGYRALVQRPELRRKLNFCRACRLPVYSPLDKRGRTAVSCPQHRALVRQGHIITSNELLRLAKPIGRAAQKAGIAPRHRRREDLRSLASDIHGAGIRTPTQLRAAARDQRSALPKALRRVFGERAGGVLAVLRATSE